MPLFKALMRQQYNFAYACSKKPNRIIKKKNTPNPPQTEKVKNKAPRIMSGMESTV